MERLRVIFKKPEYVFLIFGFLFGIIFMILTPPFEVPDEPAHFHRAIEVANGVFYNKTGAKFSEYDRILYTNPLIKSKIKSCISNAHTVSGYSPVMYLSSAVGVKIGAMFKNPCLMFYLARFFNLFVWLSLMYFAIRITPVCKWQFALFALLPMSIYEGMSLSADSFVNGFLFMFFAYMFKLIFDEKEELSSKDIIIYSCMALVSALLKACLIYPVFLIFFVKDKRKWLLGLFVITISVLVGGLWAANNHVALGANGDPVAAKEFILTEPFKYLSLFCKTLLFNSYYWIRGAIGIFGWLNIKLPEWLYFVTMSVYLSILTLFPVGKQSKKSLRVVAFLDVLLYMFLVLTALFCTWTVMDSPKICGFQGRYLICICPLFFLIFGQNKFNILLERYNKYYLLYIFILLCYSCYRLIDVYRFS